MRRSRMYENQVGLDQQGISIPDCNTCLNQHWHSCLSTPGTECISAFIYKIPDLLEVSSS